jgi:hypothetical protein
MEIYDIENLIRIINELYTDFINEWDKVFSQYHWNLIKGINNRFLRLKNSENGVEFNYIKVLRRTKYMYIDNIILEDKVLRKNSIMHVAIKDYNYLRFNIGSIMEKVDTSLIKLNEVEDDSQSRNISPVSSSSSSFPESPHQFEVQTIPVSIPDSVEAMCNTSPMSRTSANRLIQLNTNRRNSVNNIDNSSFNNTPITRSTSRLSTAPTPFSFISNSFTQDIKDLVKEITWLEICNTIIAIALALIAVSLAILFFDPHFIKFKNLIRKIISLLNKCINKIKNWLRFISNCNDFHPSNHFSTNISNPSKHSVLIPSLDFFIVNFNQPRNINSTPIYENSDVLNYSLLLVRREFIK